MTWGLPAWRLGEKEWRKLRAWNARMLTQLMGVDHEDYVDSVRQQIREPVFDLVAKLRARRLRWLGHTVRMGNDKLAPRATGGPQAKPGA